MDFINVDYSPFGVFKIRGTNKTTAWRAATLKFKEPTILEWLQCFTNDSWLIDIGANIGIYSIPAALFHAQKVIAIEPEPKNYIELLANRERNSDTHGKLDVLPLAISTKYSDQIQQLYIASDEPGKSQHQLGKNQDYMLNPHHKDRLYKSVYYISLEQLISSIHAPNDAPLHIKLDVDGIEEDVCESLFSSSLIHRISSIQVELNPLIHSHKALINKLYSAGFICSYEQVEKAIRKDGPYIGFAEHVFIPSFTPEQISAFLISDAIKKQHLKLYAKYGNESGNESHKTFVTNEFINRETKLLEFSKVPPVAIVSDLLSPKQVKQARKLLLNQITDSNNIIEFNVGTPQYQKSVKSCRISLNSNQIQASNPEYYEFITNTFTDPKLIKEIILYSNFSLVNNPKKRSAYNKEFTKPNYLLTCRIRHFVDFPGQYLTRHNDSTITLCALIIPVLPFSTSTSIISETESASFSRINPQGFTKYPSHYANYHAINYKKEIYIEDHGNESNNLKLFRNKKVQLDEGQAILLVNPECDLFNLDSNSLSIYKNNSGHALFPPITDIARPLILVDYLLRERKVMHNLINNIKQNEFLINLGEISDFL